MKVLKTLISVVLCAVVLLAGFAVAKPESLKASAAIANQSVTINPFANSVTWAGFDRTKATTITYSNTTMITPSNTKFNGNDTYTFKVNENYSSSDRTCVITAKNGSTTKTFTVTQRGKILKVSTSFTGGSINGDGQTITFSITTNLTYTLYKFKDGIVYETVKTGGKNTDNGSTRNYAVSVTFPANKTGALIRVHGIWVSANNQVATKYFTQDVHTHTWGSKVVTKAATCTEPGSGYHTCTQCPVTENCTVNPSGHTYVANKTVAPTCTSDGYVQLSCTKCGKSFQTGTTKALGHNYSLIKGSAARGVYLQCARCTAYDSSSTHLAYSTVASKLGDTEANKTAFIKAACDASGISQTNYNKIIQVTNQYDNCDSKTQVFLKSLVLTTENEFVNDLTQLGIVLGDEGCEKIDTCLSAYKIGYYMHQLVTAKKGTDAETIGVNLANIFTSALDLDPLLSATYGKYVGKLMTTGISTIKSHLVEKDVTTLYGELSQNGYDGFLTMKASDLIKNYDSLPGGLNDATDYRQLFLSLRVAYEYHTTINFYTGTFEEFLGTKSEWSQYV